MCGPGGGAELVSGLWGVCERWWWFIFLTSKTATGPVSEHTCLIRTPARMYTGGASPRRLAVAFGLVKQICQFEKSAS